MVFDKVFIVLGIIIFVLVLIDNIFGERYE